MHQYFNVEFLYPAGQYQLSGPRWDHRLHIGKLMARSKQNPAAPEVHRIALPVSDESLVIDLPDGQKLLVGKMATGSVIEVATWRGTGRPDSRTTRLMLGMSNGVAAESTEKTSESNTQSTRGPQSISDRVTGIAQNLKMRLKAIDFSAVSQRLRKNPITKMEKSEKASKWIPKSAEESTSGEVDKWLEEVMARSQKRVERLAKSSQAQQKKVVSKKAVSKKATTKRRAK